MFSGLRMDGCVEEYFGNAPARVNSYHQNELEKVAVFRMTGSCDTVRGRGAGHELGSQASFLALEEVLKIRMNQELMYFQEVCSGSWVGSRCREITGSREGSLRFLVALHLG